MAPGATSVLSIICPWLYGDSHLLEQKQEWGQDSTRRTIYFAQKFIEILLSVNAGYTVETQKESFLMVPKHVTYKLEHLYQQLIWHSGQVQGSTRCGLLPLSLEYWNGFQMERMKTKCFVGQPGKLFAYFPSENAFIYSANIY